MLIVIVAAGPDKGRIYELDGSVPVVIGREGAEIRLNDTKVSRRHARLWCEGGRWYAQDFNSRSGTHRNEATIEGKHPLNDGDRLRVGGTLLVVTRRISDTAPHPDASSAPSIDSAPSAPADALASARTRNTAWVAAAAAATVLIGLNLASLLTQQRTARDLGGLAADTPEVRDAVDRMAVDTRKRLAVATAALERQAAGGAELAHAVEGVRALQEQEGTDVAQLASAVTGVRERLDVLNNLEGLNDAAQLASNLATEITSLRTALADPDVQTAGLASIERRLDQLATQVDAAVLAGPAGGLESVASALEELRRDGATQSASLSAELGPRLDALARRLDDTPGENAIALRIDEGLARLATELGARPDAGLIREQLAAVFTERDARDAARPAVDAVEDPLLGQVLAELQTLRNDNRRLDARLAALRSAPFENRAMLDEALATLGRQDAATQDAVARQLDQAMAELRGKSITDADQLRRMINREVVAAVEQNLRHGPTDSAVASARTRGGDQQRLTRTEAAYQLAFDSGRKVAIGTGTPDPATGRSTAGRTLDPDEAKARGLSNWRDWYLMDDLAARRQAREAAEAVARRDRSRGTGVLQMPGAGEVKINAIPSE